MTAGLERDFAAIVVDVDGTLCPTKKPEEAYEDLVPQLDVVRKLVEYKNNGFRIILYTSRQMRTHNNNIGLINANTAGVLLEWLDRHGIPYDEIHYGKPWPGPGGFYVDDRTIRPDEFLRMGYEEVLKKLRNE